MRAASGDTESACPNCSAPAGGNYCSGCGQKAFDPGLTVRAFVTEIMHAFDLEGKIASTYKQLVLRPGRLTADFLAGKRARYVSPMKLYLFSSVLFFGAFFTFGNFRPVIEGGRAVVMSPGGYTTITRGDTPPGAERRRSTPAPPATDADTSAWRRFRTWFEAQRRIVKPAPNAGFNDAIRAAEIRFRSYQTRGPLLVVALVPVLALLTWVAYRGQQRLYLPHLYFSLHVHAFMLLVLALIVVPLDAFTRVDPADILRGAQPKPTVITTPRTILLVGVPYLLASLHTVFGGRWPRTIGMALLITVAYWTLMGAASDLLELATILSA